MVVLVALSRGKRPAASIHHDAEAPARNAGSAALTLAPGADIQTAMWIHLDVRPTARRKRQTDDLSKGNVTPQNMPVIVADDNPQRALALVQDTNGSNDRARGIHGIVLEHLDRRKGRYLRQGADLWPKAVSIDYQPIQSDRLHRVQASEHDRAILSGMP